MICNRHPDMVPILLGQLHKASLSQKLSVEGCGFNGVWSLIESNTAYYGVVRHCDQNPEGYNS